MIETNTTCGGCYSLFILWQVRFGDVDAGIQFADPVVFTNIQQCSFCFFYKDHLECFIQHEVLMHFVREVFLVVHKQCVLVLPRILICHCDVLSCRNHLFPTGTVGVPPCGERIIGLADIVLMALDTLCRIYALVLACNG